MEDVTKVDEVDFTGVTARAVMETFDGLRIAVIQGRRDDENYVRLHAEFDGNAAEAVAAEAEGDAASAEARAETSEAVEPPSVLKDADAVRTEVDQLNARWNGWAYVLPEFPESSIFAPKSELIEETGPATEPAAADTGTDHATDG